MDNGYWEYLVITIRKVPSDRPSSEEWQDVESGKSLKSYGVAGWELVSVIPEKWVLDTRTHQDSVISYTAFFKHFVSQPIVQ